MSSKGWETFVISDLIDRKVVSIGDGYRAKNSELSTDGLPFARVGNINDGFRFEKIDCFPLQDLYKVGDKISRPNDVVFTSKGTVGRFAFVTKDTPQFVYSPQLCFWRVLNEDTIEPRFLYYWMHSREFQEQANSVKGQTDMADYVSLFDQRRMKITLPPLSTQRRIADILSALDEKIEINRQTNATLEVMAQAIFKEWFVEYENKDNWELLPLPEIIEINPIRRLSSSEIAPYLDMANMPTKGHRAIEWRDRPFSSGTKFVNGDTLLARITPCLENGKTAFVDFLTEGQTGWGSTEFIVFRPKPPLLPEYGYYLARTEELRNHAIQNMIGTSGRQRTPTSCFGSFLTRVPPLDLAVKFGNIARVIMVQITSNDEQLRTLASIRDTLLPKLMSGKIEV